MLASIVLAALVTAAAAPTPQATAGPPLKTIASVRSSSRCAEIITHANSAIGSALSNDQLLGKTITTMQLINLDDGNVIHRRNGFTAIGDLAKTLMQQARSGDDEVKRLRALAAQTKDPKAAKELKDFADQLGGALWRQQKVARDMNGFLAYEDFKEMTTWSEADRQMNQANFGVPDPQTQMPSDIAPRDAAGRPMGMIAPMLGHDPNEATATQYAKAAAKDFMTRLPDIARDESNAATHVDAALAGC